MKKIYNIIISAILISGFIIISSEAIALQKPKPIATDHRIQTIRYSPNEIYKFTGHYGYQSIIEFGADEEVGTISIGDSVSWQIIPEGSRIFIKPIEQDALTNMTVITNKKLYHFELHAKDTENINDNDMIFVMRFSYPSAYGAGFANNVSSDGIPDLEDPEIRQGLNFRYSLVGTETIAPIRVFDDGEFTYFQFRDKNADIPAFFLVDPSGNEGVINFRTRGDYIIVERVSPLMTLRHGAEIICVFNDAMKMAPRIAPIEKTFWQKLKFWKK